MLMGSESCERRTRVTMDPYAEHGANIQAAPTAPQAKPEPNPGAGVHLVLVDV